MSDMNIEIWLFAPSGGGPRSKNLVQFLRAVCLEEGWSLQIRRTTSARDNGRPLGPIKGEDATNLYRRLHRARVGVWQIGHAHAPVNPRTRRRLTDFVELSRFVIHKAYHHRIRPQTTNENLRTSLAQFKKWTNGVSCQNEGDPRCLPFHVFSTGSDLQRLSSDEGRSEFSARHGSQSSRTDDSELRWDRPSGGGYHGREVIQVAGRRLHRGFHWDVSHPSNRHTIRTTSGIWEIRKNGYVNIYPDAYVRQGKSAKRI